MEVCELQEWTVGLLWSWPLLKKVLRVKVSVHFLEDLGRSVTSAEPHLPGCSRAPTWEDLSEVSPSNMIVTFLARLRTSPNETWTPILLLEC